jgi:hypothetical protein
MKNTPPVPADGPLVHYKNPEEFAAACHAQSQLMRLVASQEKDQLNDERYPLAETQGDQQECDQFLWGQNFDTSPEVWECFESWFEDGGIFGPRDL